MKMYFQRLYGMDKENIKLLWEENKGGTGKGASAMKNSQAVESEAASAVITPAVQYSYLPYASNYGYAAAAPAA